MMSKQAQQPMSSIVPEELLLDILSLCRPVAHLPATCQTLQASFAVPAKQPHRIWLQRQQHNLIFQSHEYARYVTKILVQERPLRRAIMVSPVSFYLKAATRKFAPLVAADPGTQPSPATVLSASCIEWLFSQVGPFQNLRRQGSRVDLLSELQRARADLFASDAPALTWRLVPDSLLLAAYFIRMSQLDLLQATLVHLRSLLPNLGKTLATYRDWYPITCASLNYYYFGYGDDTALSYPTLVSTFALVDWSSPALEIISRVFADDGFDVTISANFAASNPGILNAMMRRLEQISFPPSDSRRVLAILEWFQRHGAYVSPEHCPFVSIHVAHSYPVFADVLAQHDLARLPHVASGQAKDQLGRLIGQYVMTQGRSDYLQLALEHGLLNHQNVGSLFHHAVLTGNKALADTIAAQCIKSNSQLHDVVHYVFVHASFAKEETPADHFVALLNCLVTYAYPNSSSRDPTDFLITKSSNARTTSVSSLRSTKCLNTILFDRRANLLFAWDLPRYLSARLSPVIGWVGSADDVQFLSKVIDECAVHHATTTWDALDFQQVVWACAIRMTALAYEVTEHQASVREVGDEEMTNVEFVAAAALARIKTDVTFTQLIPLSCTNAFRAAIAPATAIRPRLSRTCDRAQPRTVRSVLVNTLFRLDPKFVFSYAFAKFRSHAMDHFDPATALDLADFKFPFLFKPGSNCPRLRS
ncbi:hypothetical protein BCR44DRAFT_40074 [Catenaria anguillulae PL171]|uniref:Uncharacterized protein n=1 Tax=Catenaria anguillulae PL171 TaxID=765915 RepID=A0A1Y2H974_9FUNG|nr:hypothetical protein BCR44DRAFT_40074 [Catenaria anguillulae PL171]